MSETRALLSPARTAELLNVSTKTLRALWEAGTLPRVRIGIGRARGRFAYDPADVEAYIRQRKEYGPPPCPSTSRRARRSTTTTSSSAVVDFAALRKELRSRRPET